MADPYFRESAPRAVNERVTPMRTPAGRACLASILTAVSLLCLSGHAQAHPHLIGRWVATSPANPSMTYDFGCGGYLGNWIWRGVFLFSIGDGVVSPGWYEVRMWTSTRGTIQLRDGNFLTHAVGTIDLEQRSMTFKSTIFTPQ